MHFIVEDAFYSGIVGDKLSKWRNPGMFNKRNILKNFAMKR